MGRANRQPQKDDSLGSATQPAPNRDVVDDPGFRTALDHHETDWQKVIELVLPTLAWTAAPETPLAPISAGLYATESAPTHAPIIAGDDGMQLIDLEFGERGMQGQVTIDSARQQVMGIAYGNVGNELMAPLLLVFAYQQSRMAFRKR
ncbi:MAG: hypothetical protein QNL91_14580 [Candidatus Krumholzibacteria bacterium]|nr:hypothetical protein [Candidatus Krumholzibacteria bacterium]